MIKIEKIRANQNNPRVISDAKFEKLCQSIKDFPQMMELRPIVVDRSGMILGGNMRFKAIVHLGYTEIPESWVKVADNLTEEEARRFIIEDNTDFGEWDLEILAKDWEPEDLVEWGLDFDFSGFKDTHDGMDQSIGDDNDQCIVSDGAGVTKSMNRVIALGFNIILTDEEAELLKRSIENYVEVNGITSGYFYSILGGNE